MIAHRYSAHRECTEVRRPIGDVKGRSEVRGKSRGAMEGKVVKWERAIGQVGTADRRVGLKQLTGFLWL